MYIHEYGEGHLPNGYMASHTRAYVEEIENFINGYLSNIY